MFCNVVSPSLPFSMCLVHSHRLAHADLTFVKFHTPHINNIFGPKYSSCYTHFSLTLFSSHYSNEINLEDSQAYKFYYITYGSLTKPVWEPKTFSLFPYAHLLNFYSSLPHVILSKLYTHISWDLTYAL